MDKPKKSRAEYYRAWRKKNPDKAKAIHERYLRKKYGRITTEVSEPSSEGSLVDLNTEVDLSDINPDAVLTDVPSRETEKERYPLPTDTALMQNSQTATKGQ